MKGCRPLTDPEIATMLGYLAQGRQSVRNRALLEVGLRTGFRISQLLSLNLGDVYQNGQITREVYCARKNVKNKRQGQRLPLHDSARRALEPLVFQLLKAGLSDPGTPLFQSRKGGKRLNRRSAWEMIRNVCHACQLDGKIANHSMRKTFAKRMLALLGGNIHKLKKLLDHTDIRATEKYLDVDDQELEAAVLKS